MYEQRPYRELPWFSPEPNEELVEAVDDGFFRPRSDVLDIGCGAGTNVLFLARRKFRAHGVDLSPIAIQAAEGRARQARLDVDVRVGDALRMPFRPRQMAAANDRGCFHTLPVGRRREYAAEVARVVRPGGAFLLTWVGRETTSVDGPPHRPSLEEVTRVLEPWFIFQRTWFRPPPRPGAYSGYAARMLRRTSPQPSPR